MQNMIKLSTDIEKAYKMLIDATQTAFEAVEKVHSCKEDLKRERETILVANADDPKRLGSNEAAREAKLNELCAAPLAKLKTAELAERNAVHELALSRLAVEACRAQLRILEAALVAKKDPVPA